MVRMRPISLLIIICYGNAILLEARGNAACKAVQRWCAWVSHQPIPSYGGDVFSFARFCAGSCFSFSSGFPLSFRHRVSNFFTIEILFLRDKVNKKVFNASMSWSSVAVILIFKRERPQTAILLSYLYSPINGQKRMLEQGLRGSAGAPSAQFQAWQHWPLRRSLGV